MIAIVKLQTISTYGTTKTVITKDDSIEILGKIAVLEKTVADLNRALDTADREVGRLIVSRAEIMAELAAEHLKNHSTGGV